MYEKRKIGLGAAGLPEGYVREVLLSGKCEAVLPMSLLEGKQNTKACFHTGGYIRVRDLPRMNAEEILTLVQQILRMMEDGRDWLLFQENYFLSMDTLYRKTDGSKVRLLYLPADCARNEKKDFCNLLYCLEELTTPIGKAFLRKLREEIKNQNSSTNQLIALLERRKEEAHFCRQ